MDRALSVSSAVVVLLLMAGIMAALGSTVAVTKTTTVSGPCTGTATLTDVSSTVVYTAPCTGTITYTSISSTSSSSSSSATSSSSTNNCGPAICHTSTTSSNSMGSDWPSFTLNNQDSRYQANSTINSANVAQMTQKWYIPTDGTTSTPVTLAGSVYFSDFGGNVYSASISTGKLNWKVNLGAFAITSTPLLANGMVYVSDGLGKTELFALSQTDGHTIWDAHLSTSMNATWASPITFGNLIYIGVAATGNNAESDSSLKGEMFAVNAITGSVIWTFNASPGPAGGAGIWGSVVVDPKLNSIYFATGNPFGSGSSPYSYSVVSLDATTGALNWYHQIPLGSGSDSDFGSTPNLFSVSIHGTIYSAIGIGNKNGVYYILDRTDGALIESRQIGIGATGIISVAGFIYLSPNNPETFIVSDNYGSGTYGILKAFVPSTNTTAWMFYVQGETYGSVAVLPGAVLFGDALGNFYAVSFSGQLLYMRTFSGQSIEGGISEGEGFVFVPTSTGVYAFTEA